MKKSVNVGLIGWGTVGTGVSKIILQKADLLTLRSGIEINLKKIADLDVGRDRGVQVRKELLTTDAQTILDDPEIDIVIELIGGIEPAKSFILKALKAGKHVVTANKALMAKHWDELQSVARHSGADIYFEAAVGGGIPVVQSLNDGLAANHVKAIYGIINGTANYILTEMAGGSNYSETLAKAQAKGYAEADPTLDVGGGDTLHKLVILSSLAFGKAIDPKDVYLEGITEITAQDIEYAMEEFGKSIKLLGIAKQTENGKIQIRVHPTMVSAEHLLAKINGVYNGIYVVGDSVGPTLFYGKGAGEMPTASAVMSDVIFIARNIHMGVAGKVPSVYYQPEKIEPAQLEVIEELKAQYYLRFNVKDEVGVIAKIAGVLGEKDISIEAVIQKARYENNMVPVVITTYEAKEKAIKEALAAIDQMPFVMKPTLRIRMEDIE